MNYWLLKTEPSVYSYDDLVRDRQTTWDGVSSPGGLRNIRNIKKGDQAFIYHTGDEKQIIGTGKITSDSYPDPKQDNARLVVFDIEPVKKLKRPVTLSEIKSDRKYAAFALVREPRLSVVEVPKEYWEDFIKLSEKKAE